MKSKLIKNLFVVLFFILQTYSNSQSISHHEKYWYYKTRLNNDFVKVGLGAGESMPFNQRGAHAYGGFNDVNCMLYVGDGSATLGMYIAVLATEYYLLAQNGQRTDSVKHELFCALNAINRLDYKAEGLWQFGAEQLNGFFIRDDIPAELLLSENGYKHFNYYNDGTYPPNTTSNINSGGFHSKMNGGANQIRSDWSRRVQNIPYENNWDPNQIDISMSHDQAYLLTFGLAFVNKFVPDWETDGGSTFGYGSGETSLTKEARNIMGRITSFIKNSKDLNGNDCDNDSWRIRNPTTCNLVPIGHNAIGFAYALAESACLITSGASSNQSGGVGLSLISAPRKCFNTSHDFHNYKSSVTGFTAWKLLASSPLPNIDNRSFAVNLMAVCNCMYGTILDQFVSSVVWTLEQIPVLNWLGYVIKYVWSFISSFATTVIPGYYKNITSTTISENAFWNPLLPSEWEHPEAPFKKAPFDHAPLARKILHGGLYLPNNDYSFDYLLDVAPCDDIYNFGSGNHSHVEWSSDSRIDHPNRRGTDAGTLSWTAPKGEYNGIDYLLYHNLWYIHKKQQGAYPDIRDLSDVYINKNNGTAPQASLYKAFETIVSENTVFYPQNNAGIMRAGKFIDFKPGTWIKTGTNNGSLHAFIQKYECATDNFYGGAKMAQDTLSEQAAGYPNEPYHHVDYPVSSDAVDHGVETNSTANNSYVIELPIEKATSGSYTNIKPLNDDGLAVYPNPAVNTTSIFYKLEEGQHANVEITDVLGKVIIKAQGLTQVHNGSEIDISELACGSYLLKFMVPDMPTKTVKLIKTK